MEVVGGGQGPRRNSPVLTPACAGVSAYVVSVCGFVFSTKDSTPRAGGKDSDGPPIFQSLPGGLCGKESASQRRRCRSSPWLGKIPLRRKWQLTPVCLPGESHGHRRVGYSLGGCGELDMT